MCRYVISFLLTLIPFVVSSQTAEIDSLKRLLPEVSGKKKADVLYTISARYSKFDAETAMHYLDTAFVHAADSVQLLKFFRARGIFLTALNRQPEIADILEPMISFAERNKEYNYLIQLSDMIATSRTIQGDYNNALRYVYRIVPFLGIDSIRANKPYIYNNIGLLYYEIMNYQKALLYYKQCYEVMPEPYPINVINIALTYFELDSLDKAMTMLNRARALPQFAEEKKNRTHLHLAFGNIYIRGGKTDSARFHLRKALLLARDDRDERMEAETLSCLSEALLADQEFDSAGYVLERAEAIATTNGLNLILLDVFRNAVNLYEIIGDNSKLVHYQEKVIAQREKMYNSELARDLARAEGEILEREHLRIIGNQSVQLEYQESIMRYQQWIVWAGVLCGCLLASLAWLQYRSFRFRKRIHALLEAKVKERITTLQEQQRQIRSGRNELLRKGVKYQEMYRQFLYDLKRRTCSGSQLEEFVSNLYKKIESHDQNTDVDVLDPVTRERK